MHRRSFLTTTLAALFAPWAAPARQTQPAPSAPARPEPGPILLQRSPLAGFQYHQGARLWSQLQAGQTLCLTREPANPYDPRAVRIDWNGEKLGYLPRIDNAAAAQLLDRGERLTAQIAALAEDWDPWRRVAVDVYLTPAEQAVVAGQT